MTPLSPSDLAAPASFGQERLWFLEQFEGAKVGYNRPAHLRFEGPLNIDALQRSLGEIVARHDALRTYFANADGRLVQRVRHGWSLTLPVTDIRGGTPSEREVQARRLALEETQIPFDLARGPLLRGRLLRLSHDDHVLLLTFHHIVFDGWSEGVMFRELAELYRAIIEGRPSPLQPLPIQYSDFALRQRQRLQGDVLESLVSYWKNQLQHRSQVLDLPTDRPRPVFELFNGARHSFQISAKLSGALRQHARSEGASFFMSLLAAFQCFLYRYTHQEDILIGCPVSGRTNLETEQLIGFFVNVLVLGGDFSKEATFRDVLRSARDTMIAALSHEDLPFEKLVDELQVKRDTSRSPLVQVLFQLRNYPSPAIALPNLRVSRFEVTSDFEKFDLNVELVANNAQGLDCRFRYNGDLFDGSTIRRMENHFHTLLQGIAANPEQRISELPLLSDSERHRLLVEWNNTRREYHKEKFVHELFEVEVEKTPEATAVVLEEQQVTYRELNIRANQLAHYLVKLGVGPEVLVAICLERSVDMIVALLAILKAGGAYLPLDPGYPQERLALMLADSRSAVVLSQQLFSDMFRHADTSIVSLDSDRDEICKENDTNLAVAISSDNLAYLLYTSGSTGVPKGVAVEHRNTLAFLSWALSAFAPEDFGGVLAATSICFDLSVFEVFATLACGGKIVLAQNALALAQLRAAGEVTLVNAVPSAITELIKLRAIPSSVRVVNLAGEPLQIALVQQIYESSSVGTVNDLYGPTECTTYSTWTCRRPDGPQTIGRPISNTKIYILDSRQTPVPIGIPGEIYIGGAGVARGYLHRPELTQEKFIANPFSNDPESRLYRTGDLARYLPDGNIEFLGRIDNQVKIRGFRIELGEIEAVVAQHPSIQQAALIAREDTPGDKRLLAYVVAAEGSTPSVHDLRSYLQHKLPDYMVPSTFVFLDSLPLTPNGKLDRKALPAPDQSRPELEDAFTAPRNPVEEILATIWSEVLKLDKVGVHDNFFHLGGHSLLATQVVSRIYSAFRIELPLRRIFESTTVAAMAMLITEHQAKGANRPELMEILPELEAMTDEQAQKAYETRLRR